MEPCFSCRDSTFPAGYPDHRENVVSVQQQIANPWTDHGKIWEVRSCCPFQQVVHSIRRTATSNSPGTSQIRKTAESRHFSSPRLPQVGNMMIWTGLTGFANSVAHARTAQPKSLEGRASARLVALRPDLQHGVY